MHRTDSSTVAAVSSDTLIPDLLRAFPQARAVFDRYGLRGCGGQFGPVETIAFFARTHGVDEQQLLRELAAAVADGSAPPAPTAPGVADTIYRRFFLAGIFIVLTAGATWGAWLLWRIGLAGKFTGISIHDVNAHGHAQIFGWVGLFIMGFAYQAFPRMWHTDLVAPRAAVAAFALMFAGIIAGTAGMTLAHSWSGALPAALAGGAAEVLAVLIFAAQILLTFQRSRRAFEPYVGFAAAALLWFVAMSVMSVWHTYTTMTAPTRDALLWYVGTYQAPLRDMQIHGLALFMILGVSLRMLPPLFGLPHVPAPRAWLALGVLMAAVVGEIVIFIWYRWTGSYALAALLFAAWAMLAAGVAMIAAPWRLWRPLPESDRSGKFVRAAWGWLAVSLLMLLAFPLYQRISGEAFSHAYYGAIRHAITVGFISLMIMGFAAKVVPTLNGIDTRSLTALWGPFILVNAGCFLRVVTQTLTDFDRRFFAIVGISGTLEVTGLAWWGLGLAAIMWRGRREMAEVRAASARPGQITADHLVADVVEWYPQTGEVFDRFGFGAIRNPILRRTIGRGVTVARASSLGGVDLEEFLRSLNEAAGANRQL